MHRYLGTPNFPSCIFLEKHRCTCARPNVSAPACTPGSVQGNEGLAAVGQWHCRDWQAVGLTRLPPKRCSLLSPHTTSTLCAPGTFQSGTNHYLTLPSLCCPLPDATCTACAPGTFQSGAAQLCTSCDSGFFSASTGASNSSTCKRCADGTTCNLVAQGHITFCADDDSSRTGLNHVQAARLAAQSAMLETRDDEWSGCTRIPVSKCAAHEIRTDTEQQLCQQVDFLSGNSDETRLSVRFSNADRSVGGWLLLEVAETLAVEFNAVPDTVNFLMVACELDLAWLPSPTPQACPGGLHAQLTVVIMCSADC